jgi:anti-repressor protein
MELIKIEKRKIGEGEINAVDARKLHAFLGSRRQFSNWITQRIKRYGFVEGVDFTSLNKTVKRASGGGSARKEYFLSIDTAKELSMVEKSKKGQEARRYFIECEKAVIKAALPESRDAVMARGLIAAQEVIGEQAKALEDAKPKIDFHDAIVDGHRTWDFKEAAKFISAKTECKIGRNKLLKLMREMKIIEKTTNEPYQRFIDAGYLICSPVLIGKSPFRKVHKQPRLTGKGLKWITPAVQKYALGGVK